MTKTRKKAGPEFSPEMFPLDQLQLDPNNARQHDERNIAAITTSLQQFGWRGVIVVRRKDKRVLAGNGRVVAARALGWTQAPVLFTDDDNAQALLYALTDNRTAELATWDEERLAKILRDLDESGIDTSFLWSKHETEELLQHVGEYDRTLTDEGPGEPPEVPVARTGDLWVLGDHRLLCGDSTNLQDVLRVMDGEKAALVATDPPYLVDYTGERPNDSGKDWTDTYREIDIADADKFFRDVFTNVLEVLGSHAAIYCWHAHKRCGDIQRIWRELGILDHQQIIWVKPTPVFGRVYWHFRHEPCVMGWKQGDKPEHDGVHDHDSVWECDWDGKARVVGNEHPTEKPVELFVRPMKKHTTPGALVLEPFSGSGSQLIAAERTGRHCRAIEISPAYVDVAIERWQKATTLEATLDGKTFAAIAKQRAREPAKGKKSRKP